MSMQTGIVSIGKGSVGARTSTKVTYIMAHAGYERTASVRKASWDPLKCGFRRESRSRGCSILCSQT